jgi:hypothetical protein
LSALVIFTDSRVPGPHPEAALFEEPEFEPELMLAVAAVGLRLHAAPSTLPAVRKLTPASSVL